jgi:hypothetical protein
LSLGAALVTTLGFATCLISDSAPYTLGLGVLTSATVVWLYRQHAWIHLLN